MVESIHASSFDSSVVCSTLDDGDSRSINGLYVVISSGRKEKWPDDGSDVRRVCVVSCNSSGIDGLAPQGESTCRNANTFTSNDGLSFEPTWKISRAVPTVHAIAFNAARKESNASLDALLSG